MIIDRFTIVAHGDTQTISARLVWESRPHEPQTLWFGITDIERPITTPSPDAFLAACYPLAILYEEPRIQMEVVPCPMLVEGLMTASAWWTRWGGMPAGTPPVESAGPPARRDRSGPPLAAMVLSGGVDGLHTLMRNRRFYDSEAPASIRSALFIHGFDIGKRATDPEEERFDAAYVALQRIVEPKRLRLVRCRTNLRHLYRYPDFWLLRHNGAALAAVGHAAASVPGHLFIGSGIDIMDASPLGSHPAVDGLFSSQQVTVVHDGARLTRLEKIRELSRWPAALADLRVCPHGAVDRLNCGRCEKCLRTRLELLAAGITETPALGPSLPSLDLWDETVIFAVDHHARCYEELLPLLQERGFVPLCRALERKIAGYREKAKIHSAQLAA
jgi:hypothetical protein